MSKDPLKALNPPTIIAALEKQKAQVMANAESACASLDRVIALFQAEALPERMAVPVAVPILVSPATPPRTVRSRTAPRKPASAGASSGASLVRAAVRAAKLGKLAGNPKLVGALRQLPEPLTVDAVQATGLFTDRKQSSNYLTRIHAAGWLERTGVGQYVRTAGFGGVSAASQALLEQCHSPERE